MASTVLCKKAASALAALLFTACTQATATSVNVLGVNYTADEFSYTLQDPGNVKNTAGGELIDSFSAGGIQCCYELPKRWRPGIKVLISTKEWRFLPASNGSTNLEEIRNSVEVEVPKYVDDKPGDLWVVRDANGSFGVVSSPYQPDHPKWPGKVKGWPVPSIEYQRALSDKYINFEAERARDVESWITELRTDPKRMATDHWVAMKKNAERYDPSKNYSNPTWEQIKSDYAITRKFSGPDDVEFVSWLLERDIKLLTQIRSRLQELRSSRP